MKLSDYSTQIGVGRVCPPDGPPGVPDPKDPEVQYLCQQVDEHEVVAVDRLRDPSLHRLALELAELAVLETNDRVEFAAGVFFAEFAKEAL